MSDIYQSVRAAIGALDDVGFAQRSDQLSDVMRAGSTPTEVLMGVRWTLGRIIEEESALPAATRHRLQSLESEVAALLST